MFALMMAWAQSATSNYVAADQDGSIAGLMTLGIVAVFGGWLAFAGVREVLRMRREDRQNHADEIYTSLDALGPTMADGGQPMAPTVRKGLRQVR